MYLICNPWTEFTISCSARPAPQPPAVLCPLSDLDAALCPSSNLNKIVLKSCTKLIRGEWDRARVLQNDPDQMINNINCVYCANRLMKFEKPSPFPSVIFGKMRIITDFKTTPAHCCRHYLTISWIYLKIIEICA